MRHPGDIELIQGATHMEYETLELEDHGAVRRILLAREAQRNAQSQQMLDELDHAFAQAAKDSTVHVVILGGKGAHFSAGHDLKQAQAERSNLTVEQRWAYERLRYFDYCMRIWDFPKPTIAQVQGACVAGGFMLANMCDMVVASESAYFSDPVGHTLGAAATEVLIHPWVMGLRKAKEMLFTSDWVSAQDAFRLGMVNHVVPRAELSAFTMAMAEKIATKPSFALKLTKEAVNQTLEAQGQWQAMLSVFNLHQLAHAHNREVFGMGMDPSGAPAMGRRPTN